MSQFLEYSVNVETSRAVNSINQMFDAFEQGANKAKSRLQQEWQKPIELEVEVAFKNGKVVSQSILSMKNDSEKLGKVWEAVNGKLGTSAKALKTQKDILTELVAKTNKFSKDNKSINKDYQLLQARLKQVNQALKLQETTVIRIKGAWRPVNEEIKRSVQNLREAARASREIGKGGAGAGDLTNQFRSANIQSQLFVEGLKRAGQAMVDFFKTGARFQLLSTQLRAFTSDTAEAEKVFDAFKTTAIRTPFTLSQVAEAGKILLAFGVDAKTATEALDRLAIIAAATGGQIDLLARNLGQIESQGRAFTRDLNQFAIQGIPIWTALSDVTGKNVVQLREMAREGTIGFTSVNAALEKLTEEGSSFEEIAGEIQNTWIGLTQRLITEIQDTAKEFMEFVDAVDESANGNIKGSLKLVADMIASLGVAFDLAGQDATLFVQTMEAALQDAPLVGTLSNILTTMERMGINTSNLTGELGRLGRQMGQLVGIEAEAKLRAQAQAMFDQSKNVKEVTAALGVEQAVVKALYEEWKNLEVAEDASVQILNARAEAVRKEMEFEKEMLQGVIDKVKERYQAELDEAEKVKGQMEQALKDERKEYDNIRESVKRRYEAEKTDLDEVIRKKQESFAQELAELNKKTPAEERLLEIRRAELRAKTNNLKLSEKERLEAQAQLDSMARSEKIAAARAKQEKEMAKLQKQKTDLQKQEKAEMQELKDLHKERMEEIQDDLDQQKELIKQITKDRDDEVKKIKDAIKYNGDVKTAVENTTAAVDAQVIKVKNLVDQYAQLAINAANAERAMRNAGQQKNSGGGGNENIPSNFAGGPIAGGQKTYINELGQEAFLSASGKLSMIDAAPWSVWKAPGAGTIIPAHLASQMSIPSGGTQVNRGASAHVRRAASSGGSIAGALKGLSGGSRDRITNNVTIQAANTTKAASDMLVEMTKLRRRRYS